MSVNKFAELKDSETGETIAEFIAPPNALSNDDALSHGLYVLSETIIRGLMPDERGGGLGGDFGYGANYENDVFLMHRFCWCESEDCLWCGGSSCLVGYKCDPHRARCYQLRLGALQAQYGERFMPDTYPDSWHVPYGSPNEDAYELAKQELCKELKQDYRFGNEVHCTCGVDVEQKARYDACACDWHVGRGIYRFGKAATAPNFWHKASGLTVEWYKWIGRDMEVNQEVTVETWATIVKECYDSLPQEARDKAKAEREFESTPEYLAEEAAAEKEFRATFITGMRRAYGQQAK